MRGSIRRDPNADTLTDAPREYYCDPRSMVSPRVPVTLATMRQLIPFAFVRSVRARICGETEKLPFREQT